MTSTVTLNLRATWQDIGTEAFTAKLVELGYALPVTEQPGNFGEIIDASGKNILQVDPMGVRDDDEVSAIAALVTLAINMAGGFAPIAAPILSKPAACTPVCDCGEGCCVDPTSCPKEHAHA